MNLVLWDSNKISGGAPQLKGARWFSYEELKKYTNNFSAANEIGSGGYGKVSFKCLFSPPSPFVLLFLRFVVSQLSL